MTTMEKPAIGQVLDSLLEARDVVSSQLQWRDTGEVDIHLCLGKRKRELEVEDDTFKRAKYNSDTRRVLRRSNAFAIPRKKLPVLRRSNAFIM